jgi:hypothetical protein
MDVAELDARFVSAVAAIPCPVRDELVQILESSPARRAELIGSLYQRSALRPMVELLIDLEEDERVRALVLAELHNQCRHP